MNNGFTYIKLPSDPCLSEEQMLNYIDGRLSVTDQHACEKHMLDCEMCSDALEGLMQVKNREVLTKPLRSLTGEIETPGKVIPIAQKSKRLWYAAAAVLVLVLGSTFFFRQLADKAESSGLAENKKMDSISAPGLTEQLTVTEDSVSAAPGSSVLRAESASGSGPVDANSQTEDAADSRFAGDAESAEVLQEGQAKAVRDPAFEAVTVDQDAAPATEEATVFDDYRRDEVAAPEQESTEKKSTFWEKSKATVPAGNNTGVKNDKQTLSDKDNRSKNENLKKESGNAAPKVAESPQSYNTPAEMSGGTVAASDSIQMRPPAPYSLKPSDKDLELSYTNGLNLYNSGQYNSALVFFDEVIKYPEHVRFEDAQWQKANTLIKLNHKEEAKVLLKSIEEKKGKHSAEAAELLKTL